MTKDTKRYILFVAATLVVVAITNKRPDACLSVRIY